MFNIKPSLRRHGFWLDHGTVPVVSRGADRDGEYARSGGVGDKVWIRADLKTRRLCEDCIGAF